MLQELFEAEQDAPVEFLDRFPGDIELFIKREDLIHPHVSGNKWRKLKYNLLEAVNRGAPAILTFGGAYSNHLHAVASAGSICGLKTIGIVRGEIPEPLNPTLQQASDWGMELVPVTRKKYRWKSHAEFLDHLRDRFGDFYLIPEGGSNAQALRGVSELTRISEKFDYWCISCGTGGTMAGLLCGLSNEEIVLGFPALKGGSFLREEINQFLKIAGVEAVAQWDLVTDYHFGGYAKISQELIDFIIDFNSKYTIQLDPVYTGKMMFGVTDLIKSGFFRRKSKILAVHTGGLQGIAGIEKKYGIQIN